MVRRDLNGFPHLPSGDEPVSYFDPIECQTFGGLKGDKDREVSSHLGTPAYGSQNHVGDVNSTAKGSGARYNGGKPDFSLIPMHTLEDEARVWMYGANKYAAWNWVKGMDWSIPFACAMRHLAKWQAGEELDEESGLPHLAHAMCNLRMLTLYTKMYPEGDNRPPKEFMK